MLTGLSKARRAVTAAAAAAVILVGLTSTATAAPSAPSNRAVVIVSGGAAISPFTTPTSACRTGYAAGSTDTFMRNYLLKQGYRVFTSPAMAGLGRVAEQPAEGGPFGNCPKALPSYMTVDSTGDIDLAGVHLSNFLLHLHSRYGITSVDLVAHSMGGLYSRSAIAYLKDLKSPITVNTLTTMGTPWDGTFFANPKQANDPNSACDDFAVCTSLLQVFGLKAPVVLVEDKPTNLDELNVQAAGVLKGIPVTMIAGDAFTKAGGDPDIWPNDGIVAETSAFGETASDAAINHRRCYLYSGGTHSIYISKEAGLADSTAITWNPTVGNWIAKAIAAGSKGLSTPNRIGCPPPAAP